MIDGDPWAGWRDMTDTQQPGQWVQVDMQKPQTFNKITLDNTWALWDTPASYAVSVSDDGQTWSPPIATGPGTLGITTITFPRQTARYLRITQTGTNPSYPLVHLRTGCLQQPMTFRGDVPGSSSFLIMKSEFGQNLNFSACAATPTPTVASPMVWRTPPCPRRPRSQGNAQRRSPGPSCLPADRVAGGTRQTSKSKDCPRPR